MTDAADDDDSTIVTAQPVRQPISRLPLSRARASRILLPAAALRPALIFSLAAERSAAAAKRNKRAEQQHSTHIP